ncbi:MAG: FGGY family carbohydrate kinase [Defluviitaleaceae bacterium]|nr:FGGY family carbohydrate kinase [Defluviitaleaceae bacterium]
MFLTLDVGTTSVKVCVLNKAFKVLAKTGIEYVLETSNNKAELSPQIYWDSIAQGINQVGLNCNLKDVKGISITTQGETLIPVDINGAALHNAIVWLDTRAIKEAESINKVVDQKYFFSKTGIPECNGLCPISKLLWFKNNEADIYNQAKYFLLLEDFIIWKLTGKFVTEKSLLSTTGYFDLTADDLWVEIFDLLELDVNKIPTVMGCAEVVGEILPGVANDLGLNQGIKIVTGAMDQVCGAIGAGNFNSNIITETTGTALCIGTTRKSEAIDTTTFIPVYRHFNKDLQLLLPVCMTAGMALKWFKDIFCKEEDAAAIKDGVSVYEKLSNLAKRSPPLANGLTILPYFSGTIQPIFAPDCKATFSGIGLHTTKSDFVRGIMEGVGYMLKENIILLKATDTQIVSMGGGANSPIWNQIKADILNTDVIVPSESETTSIGVAMLCALGLSVYKTLEEAHNLIKQETTKYSPNKQNVSVYCQGFNRYKALSKMATGDCNGS